MRIMNQPEKPENAEIHVILSRLEIERVISDIEDGDVNRPDQAYHATNEFMRYLRSL